MSRRFKLALGGFLEIKVKLSKQSTSLMSFEVSKASFVSKTTTALLIRPQISQNLPKTAQQAVTYFDSLHFPELQRQRRRQDCRILDQHGRRPIHLCQMSDSQEDPEDTHGEVRGTRRLHEPRASARNQRTHGIGRNRHSATVCRWPVHRCKLKHVC
jgi:hypothetical protein